MSPIKPYSTYIWDGFCLRTKSSIFFPRTFCPLSWSAQHTQCKVWEQLHQSHKHYKQDPSKAAELGTHYSVLLSFLFNTTQAQPYSFTTAPNCPIHTWKPSSALWTASAAAPRCCATHIGLQIEHQQGKEKIPQWHPSIIPLSHGNTQRYNSS